MHRGDKHDVMRSLAWDGQPGHIKWLAKNLPVHSVAEKFAECVAVDVGGRKDGFVCVLTCPRQIVVVGKNVNLAGGGGKATQQERCCEREPRRERRIGPGGCGTRWQGEELHLILYQM